MSTADRKLMVVTSKSTVRNHVNDVGHLTLMLCTCADGTQVKPLFIWPTEAKSVQVSHSALSGEIAEVWSEKGYMTSEIFEQWIMHFIEAINGTMIILVLFVNFNTYLLEIIIEKRRNSDGVSRTVLLIIDGHQSRLNSRALLTACCNNIVVLCLPSHI